MSQNATSCPNTAGATFRTNVNNAFDTVVTLNSGTAAPGTTSAGMLWYDTTNAVVKQRNATNTGWITRWTVANAEGTLSTNLLFTADNTYDIGASGATRPRDFFLGRNAAIGGTLGVTGTLTGAAANFSGTVTGTGTVQAAFVTGGYNNSDDVLTIAGQTAGSGPTMTAQNNAANAYRPLGINASAIVLNCSIQMTNADSNIIGATASGRFGINGDPAGFGTGPSLLFRGSTNASGATIEYYTGSTQAIIFTAAGGLQIKTSGLQLGSPTGGDKGSGTGNFAGDIYKNNTAYTNPDYVLEHWATGKVAKFADKPGAAGYAGLMSLADTEAFAREHWHLPRFGQEAEHGLFSGSDALLASVEEAYIHLFNHEKRLRALEA